MRYKANANVLDRESFRTLAKLTLETGILLRASDIKPRT